MNSGDLYLYQISISTELDKDDFITFMTEQVFPAVRKGVTRAGQIETMKMFRVISRNPTDPTHEFMLMSFGRPIRDVLADIESFGATVSDIGLTYREVAQWTATDENNGAEAEAEDPPS
jgi:hypothetical protein